MSTNLVFGLVLLFLQGGISAHGGQTTDSPQKNSPIKIEGSMLWRKACSRGITLLFHAEMEQGGKGERTPEQLEKLLSNCFISLETLPKEKANKIAQCMVKAKNLLKWAICKELTKNKAEERIKKLVICCFEAGGTLEDGVCVFYDTPLNEYDTQVYIKCAGSPDAPFYEVDVTGYGSNKQIRRSTSPRTPTNTASRQKSDKSQEYVVIGEAVDSKKQERQSDSTTKSTSKGRFWLDSASGLTWQITPTSGKIQHNQAWQHCNALKLDGGGWRVPKISELRSLIRACANTMPGGKCGEEEDCSTSDSMDKSCFSNAYCKGCAKNKGPGLRRMYWPPELQGEGVRYWSSTHFSMDGGYDNWVRTIDFDNASIGDETVYDLRGNPYEGGEMTARHVRCVR
jgi:hypothetical protein